jgi:hypothetical protein
MGIGELIPGATVNNNVITVPQNYSLITRIATASQTAQEISRQERVFIISCWCSGENQLAQYNPTIRDTLADAIDIAMKLNYRMVLADDFFAQVFPMEAATPYVDDLEKSLIMRRDLHYNIQYPTTVSQNFMTLVYPETTVSPLN